MMVATFCVPLPAFSQQRMVRVYVPNSYELGEKRYPVWYLHDGQNVFQDQEAIGGILLRLAAYLDERNVDVIVVGN